MTRLGKALGGVLAVLLMVPAAPALAADDPDPVTWPTILAPSQQGSGSDPAPIQWTTITKPSSSDSGSDPQPATWPQVQKE